MSIWKSPIVYVGLALLLTVGALTIAPRFIDWTSYRAGLENYGQALTGRKVTIEGNISARLFPWPSLRLEGLSIANPEGSRATELLRAEAVEASFLLGPLLGGHFEVSAITVSKPLIGLERLADGSAGWLLSPQGSAPRLPSSIAFDNITLSDGTVRLSDGVSGAVHELTALEAAISAPALTGPWKLRGTFSDRGRSLAVSASTGSLGEGKPLSFSARVRPATGAGHELGLDAQTVPQGFVGKLAITPVAATSDADAKPKGLALKADVAGDMVRIDLTKLEITPADPSAAGNMLTGTATFDFTERAQFNANLSATHFDMVKLAEATGLDPAAASLASLGDMLAMAPVGLEGDLSLSLASLALNGGNLTDAKLRARLQDGALLVSEATAEFPGQTRVTFKGAMTPGPELQGFVQMESAALRDFALWAVPARRHIIINGWTGQRGNLSLSGPLIFADDTLAIADAIFTLDETRGTAGLRIASGKVADTTLRIIADKLDLDRYLSEGVTASAFAAMLTDTGATALRSDTASLTLQADRLLLNGVAAEDIAVSVSTSSEGLNIETVDIGSVEGARLEIAGMLKPDAARPAGSGTLKITAAEPDGLLRLLGLLPPAQARKQDPAWAAGIAPLELVIKADAETRDGNAVISLQSNGRAGGSVVSASVGFTGDPLNWRLGEAELKGRIESTSDITLAAMFGLPAQVSENPRAAVVDFSASGKLASGLEAQLALDGFGGRSTFNGTISPDEKQAMALRALGVMEVNVKEGNALLAAIGLPVPPMAVALEGDGRLDWRPGRFGLRGFSGSISGARLTGDFARGPDGFDVAVSTESLSLPLLLRGLFLRADVADPDMTTLFSKTPLEGARGKLKIEAETLTGLPAVAAGKTVIEASADGTSLNFTLNAETPASPFSVSLRGVPENGALKVDGTVKAALSLKSMAAPAADGLAKLDGRFSGAGRSPAGLVLSLTGAGRLELQDLVLANVNPQALASALANASTAQDVSAALTGPFVAGEFRPGPLSATYTIAEGEIEAEPMVWKGADGLEASLKPVFSFHEGRLDAELALIAAKGLQPVRVSWTGAPGSIERSVDANALLSALSVKAMREDMLKLEAMQKEQQRLLEEEQKRAAEEEKRRAAAAAERIAREKAAQELARKLEEEAARRIAAEQDAATKPAPVTPVPPPPPPPKKKPLLPLDPAAVESAPLPPIRN